MLVKVLDSDTQQVWGVARHLDGFRMTNIPVRRVDAKDVKTKNHEFRRAGRDSIKAKFLRHIAEKGYLDGILDEEAIATCKKGYCPKGYDVHHVIPLAFGGKNEFGNFCLIERRAHQILNRRLFDKMLPIIDAFTKDERNEARVLYMPIPKFKIIADTRKVYDFFKTPQQTEMEVKKIYLAKLRKMQRKKYEEMRAGIGNRDKTKAYLKILQSNIMRLQKDLRGEALPPIVYQKKETMRLLVPDMELSVADKRPIKTETEKKKKRKPMHFFGRRGRGKDMRGRGRGGR